MIKHDIKTNDKICRLSNTLRAIKC